MTNPKLEIDYVFRAGHRLEALRVLFERRSYADVVREAQEIVELCLKALLRASGVTVPQIHDVGSILLREVDRLPVAVRGDAARMAAVSRDLRRDREIAFYGAEDLVPSEFYGEAEAAKALDDARWIHSRVSAVVEKGGPAADAVAQTTTRGSVSKLTDSNE
ncbi:MAG: HEPN domain-containing protein [Candidatus Binatia bacterium]